jgi:hypothetical protein
MALATKATPDRSKAGAFQNISRAMQFFISFSLS